MTGLTQKTNNFFGEAYTNCQRDGKIVWLAMAITLKIKCITIFILVIDIIDFCSVLTTKVAAVGNYNINIAFENHKSLKMVLKPTKDRLKKEQLSNIVYNIQCKDNNLRRPHQLIHATAKTIGTTPTRRHSRYAEALGSQREPARNKLETVGL